MDPVVICPTLYRQFGSAEGVKFSLVTNPDIQERFTIERGGYESATVVPYGAGDSFDRLLEERIPEPSHILVISPNCFFVSPAPESLGPRRKLIVLPCNSTRVPAEAISYFLGVVERTDPDRQQQFADRFFDLGRSSERLLIVDEEYGTRATFDHLDESYCWNQQAGLIEWGEQQIAPSGELSVLPVDITDFDHRKRLAINGDLALKGQPAVHSGTPSFLPEDQLRTYSMLETMRRHAVIASVENGVIQRVEPTNPECEPAARMLENLFEVDSRYRIIWESGFGINTDMDLYPGNVGMNEPYGAQNGVAHWGLGLTPFTQYAIIIICPGATVLGRDDQVMVGRNTRWAKMGSMRPKKVASCACQY
jgi:hypothetical protein